MINKIFDKVDSDTPITKEEAIKLLSIDNKSKDFYKLIGKSNELSRSEYGNKAYIFVQIGLNSEPCSGNCKFCSLAKDNYAVGVQGEKSADDVIQEVKTLLNQNVSDLFLMTTADYNFDKYIDISVRVKKLLPEKMKIVANIGDFDIEKADILKEIGYTGAYHIVRLREGIDTDIPPQKRVNTLNAIKSAGLDLYYCVEPIGKEHSYEELVDEMIRARDYEVDVMAAMRRVEIKGSVFEDKEEISEIEFTKIAAVTRLVTRPKRSMNVHEPVKTALLAGVNQLYAEAGVNPRDTKTKTEESRGLSPLMVKKMLRSAEYEV